LDLARELHQIVDHALRTRILEYSTMWHLMARALNFLDGQLAAIAYRVVNLALIFHETRWRALYERNRA